MWITRQYRHPVFATMVMVGLMVLGLFSYRSLGVESMPNVEIPAAWIETQYPGASPEQVENDVTRPIEEASTPSAASRTSAAIPGKAAPASAIEFQLTTDMDRAVQDLRDRMAPCAAASRKRSRNPS
jgi:multidrug efflux pump subunit AcrB